jgi:hypothetical protein
MSLYTNSPVYFSLAMKTCNDLKIVVCPQCCNGREDLCWIEVFRVECIGCNNDDIKHYSIEQHNWYANPDNKSLLCSYWLEECIKLYYIEFMPVIDKIKLLL